jgi:hypothetical protein
MGPPARSSQIGDERYAAVLGRRMSIKSSTLLFYALILSILLLMAGFLGLAVYAFASAHTGDSIFLILFVILVEAILQYFILRRPLPRPA